MNNIELREIIKDTLLEQFGNNQGGGCQKCQEAMNKILGIVKRPDLLPAQKYEIIAKIVGGYFGPLSPMQKIAGGSGPFGGTGIK